MIPPGMRRYVAQLTRLAVCSKGLGDVAPTSMHSGLWAQDALLAKFCREAMYFSFGNERVTGPEHMGMHGAILNTVHKLAVLAVRVVYDNPLLCSFSVVIQHNNLCQS